MVMNFKTQKPPPSFHSKCEINTTIFKIVLWKQNSQTVTTKQIKEVWVWTLWHIEVQTILRYSAHALSLLEKSQTPSERHAATAAWPGQVQGRKVAEAVLLYLAMLYFSHQNPCIWWIGGKLIKILLFHNPTISAGHNSGKEDFWEKH